MDLHALHSLPPAALADLIPRLLSAQLEVPDLPRMRFLVEEVRDWEWPEVLAMLSTLGDDYRLYPPSPPIRELSRLWMGDLVHPHEVEGAEHLRTAMAAGPTVIVTNHLAYVDANATDALIQWSLGSDIADRVAYLAGPKVYIDAFRRLAVAGLASVPVPQSRKLATGESMTPRELARCALQSVVAATSVLDDGGALLFYPEGSRSRSGRMGPFLQATRRYLRRATWLVPAALVGTGEIMSVESDKVQPAATRLHFAPAIRVGGTEDVQEVLDGRDALRAAHMAIAARLPAHLRPAEGTPELL